MSSTIPYVAIIDVGHGNSTVIRDYESSLIVDCGLGSALLEFLKKENIKSIEAIFLSHSDQDHIGGLIGLLSSNEFAIRNIFVNPDSTKKSVLWDDLNYELSLGSVSGGTKFNTGISTSSNDYSLESIILKVVGPSPYMVNKSPGGTDKRGRKLNTNSVSASFHIIYEGKIIAYLAGDIDQIAVDDLVDHRISLEAPLLVFPHHGGKSDDSDIIAFTTQICDLTKATTVIFSIGRNKFDNPRPEVIQAVRKIVPNVRIACTQLSKHCANNLPSTSPSHLLNFFSQGRSRNECCSGTFMVQLGEGIQHFPDTKSHKAFIEASAPSSMCVDNEREQMRVD